LSIGDKVGLPESGRAEIASDLDSRLLGSLFLKRAVPSAECVDNRLAEAAIAAGN
jgi:hypothetical protein